MVRLPFLRLLLDALAGRFLLSPAGGRDGPDEQGQQHGSRRHRSHQNGVDAHGVRRDAGGGSRLRGLDPLSADQEAMGIDAVRGTGDEGAVILPLLNHQIPHLVREDDVNLIHLIAKGIVKNLQQKMISL